MRKIITATMLAGAASIALPCQAQTIEPTPPPAPRPSGDAGVWRVSTGINVSEGDYGDTQKTTVVSAPIAIKYKRGGFSVRLSVPWVSIDGPGSLLDTPQGQDPGFGDGTSAGTSGSSTSGSTPGGSGSSGSGSSGSGSSGSGSSGSGSGGSGSSGSGSGGTGTGTSTGGTTVVTAPGATSNRRSGIGDTSLTLGYSLDLTRSTWLDTTARFKLPTASTANRIGTGKVDVTLGAELGQGFGPASIYVGAHRKFIGKPSGSTLRDVWAFGSGLSYRLPGGTIIGADYDWQQSATVGRNPSSEVTGWVNFGLSKKLRLQLFGSTGLSSNSADFAGGLSLSLRLN
ncbi:MAG: hypothetical protein ACKOQM_10080 [Novosphingobium sp.]